MPKIEIGAGIALAVLGSFEFFGEAPVACGMLLFSIFLILHGSYDEFFKPWMFLEGRITHWLLERHWSVRQDEAAKSRFGFYFCICATDEGKRTVAITREKGSKNVLAFTAKVPVDDTWWAALGRLSGRDQIRLVEEIRVMLATKSMGFDGLQWPLDNLAVQTAQPLDHVLSEHKVDVTAKEVLHAVIAARSLIRRAITE